MTPKFTCTAPCIPPCTQQATFKLLNMKSRVVLGVNCDEHLEPLLKLKNGERDYDKAPIDDNMPSWVKPNEAQPEPSDEPTGP
jgi:hypothetical protein